VDWRARLSDVDAIVVSGGNTFYLLDQLRKAGFKDWLLENCKSKTYVGISAGSIVMTPSIAVAAIEPGDKNLPGLSDLAGFAFVNFELSPHTPEHVSHESNKKYKQSSKASLYGLDDQSAVMVVDGGIEFVSEGHWASY
jgi:dipeptidase E